jgi:ribulose kinase
MILRCVLGLTLDQSLDNLALLYVATVQVHSEPLMSTREPVIAMHQYGSHPREQALAYGTRHIIEALQDAGHSPITDIFVSGSSAFLGHPASERSRADVVWGD